MEVDVISHSIKRRRPSRPAEREVTTTSKYPKGALERSSTSSSCWVKGCNSTPSPTVQSTPANRTVERDSAVSGY